VTRALDNSINSLDAIIDVIGFHKHCESNGLEIAPLEQSNYNLMRQMGIAFAMLIPPATDEEILDKLTTLRDNLIERQTKGVTDGK